MASFKSEVLVTGIKRFKGEVEGKGYDSFKVFIQEKLDESRGNQKGFSVAEYGLGTSDEYDKWKHLPFPVKCEAEFETVISGGQAKIQLAGLKPLKAAPAQS